LTAVVWYWYVHCIKPVDRNVVGKVIEIKDAVLWSMLHVGRDSIYLRTAFPKLGNKLPNNMVSYSIRL
jgi:hypothetical protein